MKPPVPWLLLLLSLFSGASADLPTSRADFPFEPVCKVLESSEELKKDVYTVGVLAIRGYEAANNEFNKTFGDYLTATAGQMFDPPIRFEMKPLNFLLLFSDVEDQAVDFIYVNPSAFSW